MTRNEALYEIMTLAGYSQSPANAAGNPAANASLDSSIRDAFLSGWNFNLMQIEIEPDGLGVVAMPAGMTFVESAPGETRAISPIGNELYDQTNRLATFASTVRVIARRAFTFDELPPAMQVYAVADAAVKMAERHSRQSGPNRGVQLRGLYDYHQRAQAAARSQDDNMSGVNYLNNAETLYQTGRLGP